MQVSVEVIMPTPVRRAIAELFGDHSQGRALLRTVRFPPAPVRTETALAAERLLAGAHRGYMGITDSVLFVKAREPFDYATLEELVLASSVDEKHMPKGATTGRMPTRP